MKRVARIVVISLLAGTLISIAVVSSLLHDPNYRKLITIGPQQTMVIRNVRLFAATGTSALEGYQVVIADGRIARVEPTTDDSPPGAQIIDGAGKTLLPGLIDFHTHIANSPAPPWYLTLPNPGHNLEAYLYAGVTTVASMGDDLEELRKIRDRLERREIPGPRLLSAGLPITKKGGHPQAAVDAVFPRPFQILLPEFAHEIEIPSDAEAAVARMVEGGARYVKLVVDDLPPGVPKLSSDHIAAIVAAAHRRNMKVAAHVGKAEDALLAATSGVDVLNHGIHRGRVTPEQAKALASTGIVVSPTLIVFERCAQLAEAKMSFDQLDREIEAEEVLAQLSDAAIQAHQTQDFMRPWFEEVLASREDQRRNALALHQAGIPIFVGTDSSILGNIAGSSIHHEMRLLVEAGIPPAVVLLGATSRPAAFFYERPEIGAIEVGKIADLLLVDGNPLEDIDATTRIVLLIQDGRPVQRHTP